MTIVASWFNNESPKTPSIWTASDTKISFETGATLQGNKIFELSVVCKQLSGNGYGTILHRSSLTFAYAGSTMLAVNTFATLNTVLGNLGGGGVTNRLLPDGESILRSAATILRMHNMSIRNAGEITICGVCPKSGRLFIGKVTAKMKEDVMDYSIDLYFNDLKSFTCVLMGSHKEPIRELVVLEIKKNKTKRHAYWRAPFQVLANIVSEETYPDEIGGNLLLSVVYPQWGTKLYSVTREVGDGTQKYQNIDIFGELGNKVGECLIAIDSMIIDFDSVDAFYQNLLSKSSPNKE
ncbi:hypothetical protein [Mucilaginibacter sp. dw_454]|uniref:hypothetical protein n=1 Tax=Mucilaginibacter sp. dw_454 TaxID=2720079 RepID=UPI001BD59706|nr:hypothetical protein [Mucilaginibacter sp. dw_454]